MNARHFAVAATLVLAQSSATLAADIRVLSTGGIRPPIEELVPQFQRTSGHKVEITFMGGPAVKQQIDGGALFDVTVAAADVIDELIKAGKLAPATRSDIARAGVGVAVRAGAPKPDISSVDAFKRSLLNAKSVAYAKDGTAGMHFHGVLQRLGISKDMEPKIRSTTAADPNNSATLLVARGEVEMSVAAIATLFRPGVDFVGPLPSELQSYSVFAAAVGSSSKEQKAAAEFIKFVTAPAAAAAFKAKGMEPAPQR